MTMNNDHFWDLTNLHEKFDYIPFHQLNSVHDTQYIHQSFMTIFVGESLKFGTTSRLFVEVIFAFHTRGFLVDTDCHKHLTPRFLSLTLTT